LLAEFQGLRGGRHFAGGRVGTADLELEATTPTWLLEPPATCSRRGLHDQNHIRRSWPPAVAGMAHMRNPGFY